MKLLSFAFIFYLVFWQIMPGHGQDSIHISHISEFEFSSPNSTFTAIIDREERPFVYTANMQLGLVIFDISNIKIPRPIDTLAPAFFQGLHVSNLLQREEELFVSLGNFQSQNQAAALAILDITDPEEVLLKGFWQSAINENGCAITQVEGDYAYLGSMEGGLIILDITNPDSIEQLSQFVPDPSWPGVNNIVPNARGMTVRNDTVYIAYDSGGLRVIDASDKEMPVPIGRYVNFDLTARAAPAYNNVSLVGDYAFIAIDYCGLEVVDISKPDSMWSVNWINPWNCIGLSWFGSDGHTNQMVKSPDDQLLFVSGGDSEALIYDISDPTIPKQIGAYAFVKDSTVSWGLDVFGKYIVLAGINNSNIPLLQPFYSDFGGIQILEWEKMNTTNLKIEYGPLSIHVFPNPASAITTIQYQLLQSAYIKISLYDLHGSLYSLLKNKREQAGTKQLEIDVGMLPRGIYSIQLQIDDQLYYQKLMVQ